MDSEPAEADHKEAPVPEPVDASKSKRKEKRHTPGSALLGYATRQRRDILGVTQEEVAEKFDGPSVASLRTIENSQADNYRARTLLSLDAALAWPRGFSMVLLTGELDQLDEEFKYQYQEDFGVNMQDPWGLDNASWDSLVNYCINHVDDDNIFRYDMPIRSAKPPRGSRAKSESIPLAEALVKSSAAVQHMTTEDFLAKRRDGMSDQDLIVNTVTRLTPYLDDPRIKEGLRGVVQLAFAGIINDWDIFDERGNLKIALSESFRERGFTSDERTGEADAERGEATER